MRRLYVNEGLSIAEVARRLNTSYDKVALRLHRYGVPVRPGGREPADPVLALVSTDPQSEDVD